MKFIVSVLFLLSISACSGMGWKNAATTKIKNRELSAVAVSPVKRDRALFHAEALAEKIAESLLKWYKTKKIINLQITRINATKEQLLSQMYQGESTLDKIETRRQIHARPLIDNSFNSYDTRLLPIPSGITWPEFINKDDRAAPLVSYILGQKKRGISHINLFLTSVKIYKDPFTALGIISYIFKQEANYFNDGSKKNKYADEDTVILYAKDKTRIRLSSRMQDLPLKNHSHPYYHLSDNHHFWAYLNISIMNNGSNFLEKGINFFVQKVLLGELSDYSSNLLGIKTGELVYHYLNKSRTM